MAPNYKFHDVAGTFMTVAYDVVADQFYHGVPGIAIILDGSPEEFEQLIRGKSGVAGASARCNGHAHTNLLQGLAKSSILQFAHLGCDARHKFRLFIIGRRSMLIFS
jgi:hypothetical protein